MSKATLATVKAFIRKNRPQLLISCLSSFDAMQDGVRSTGDASFSPALTPDADRNHSNTLGIQGAWFVFGSRDYISEFESDGVRGFHVSNSCGSFDIGVRV